MIQPVVRIVPPKEWYQSTHYILEEMFELVGVRVPVGLKTDGATISRWFTPAGLLLLVLAYFIGVWWFFSLSLIVLLIPTVFPKLGRYTAAAFLHDHLWDKNTGRHYANRKFKQAMIESDIQRWRIYFIMAGVIIFAVVLDIRDYCYKICQTHH